MTTITPTVTERRGSVKLVQWLAITHADDGGTTALASDHDGDLAAYPDKTISAQGTFGGGLSLALQGSHDGTNWHACHSVGGSITLGIAIAFTATGQSAVVAQNFAFYRLIRTSGSASSVNVRMSCVR